MSRFDAVVCGLGNIGAHLVSHLARLASVRRILLVDPQRYEAANLRTQDIVRADVGRPKATVQARRLRRIDPTLAVTAFVGSIEDVPLGRLAARVLVSCLDSRAARRTLGAIAWRHQVPMVDAGVRGEDLLARVTVYVPGLDASCYECAFSERDYANLEQVHPCAGGAVAAPTGAPSGLGALAAALQALECDKLLTGRPEHAAVGRQVTMCALTHRVLVTRLVRNPQCAFDHEPWTIRPLDAHPRALTLADAFDLGRATLGGAEALRLGVAHQWFARRVGCIACGASRTLGLRLVGRLTVAERSCPECERRMRAGGFDTSEWLVEDELPAAALRVSLRSIGFTTGDVVSVRGGESAAHFQIGGSA
jgi:molybdopterin/thiamine biosynthesis adenylyltransferase